MADLAASRNPLRGGGLFRAISQERQPLVLLVR